MHLQKLWTILSSVQCICTQCVQHTIHIAQTVAKFSRKFIEFKTVKQFTCKTVGTAKPNAVAKLSKIILDICKIITIIESLLS